MEDEKQQIPDEVINKLSNQTLDDIKTLNELLKDYEYFILKKTKESKKVGEYGSIIASGNIPLDEVWEMILYLMKQDKRFKDVIYTAFLTYFVHREELKTIDRTMRFIVEQIKEVR